jgi:signal peptidase II
VTLRATRLRPHWTLFVGLAATIVVLDQLTKAWVVGSFAVGLPVEIVGDWLRIAITHNTGALFGMFRDSATLFALFSILVIGLIVGVQARAGRNLLLTIALGLLLGGALGNFSDRVRLGYVVDFVDMGIGTWRFYTYNVADAAITASILTLIGMSLFPDLARRLSGDA